MPNSSRSLKKKRNPRKPGNQKLKSPKKAWPNQTKSRNPAPPTNHERPLNSPEPQIQEIAPPVAEVRGGEEALDFHRPSRGRPLGCPLHSLPEGVDLFHVRRDVRNNSSHQAPLHDVGHLGRSRRD